eukprot:gene18364-24835_t
MSMAGEVATSGSSDQADVAIRLRGSSGNADRHVGSRASDADIDGVFSQGPMGSLRRCIGSAVVARVLQRIGIPTAASPHHIRLHQPPAIMIASHR